MKIKTIFDMWPKVNYTPKVSPKTLRLAVLIALFASISTLAMADGCPIKVPNEARSNQQSSQPTEVQNRSCTESDISWTNLSAATQSDDVYTTISLQPNEESQCLTANNFDTAIPQDVELVDLEFIIESRAGSFADMAENAALYITNNDGDILTDNLFERKRPIIGFDGPDILYTYSDIQELIDDEIVLELLRSRDFGISLQVSNQSDDDLIVYVDQLTFNIEYTENYTICNHECLTFFVNESPENLEYRWTYPPNFSVVDGSSEVGHIINIIGDETTEMGEYEICLEIVKGSTIKDQCCRKFVLADCEPGAVGDYVWLDSNGNGRQDDQEQGLENITVELFDAVGILMETTQTDDQGGYLFSSIPAGNYFIKLSGVGSLMPTVVGGSNSSNDSNITEDNGELTSSTFIVGANGDRRDIDAGLTGEIRIGDRVWLDEDGDGIQDFVEPGIEGIQVTLLNLLGETIQATNTDDQGRYFFENIAPGPYQIQFSLPSDFIATTQDVGRDELDSDINSEGLISVITITDAADNLDYDAGFYKVGSIGDYVWEDQNFDGLQDDTEPGINGVSVELYNENGILVQSAITEDHPNNGSAGFYNFENINPGSYYIIFRAENVLVPTIKVAGNKDRDSDIDNSQAIGSTSIFKLISDQTITDIDGGLVMLNGIVEGQVWFDSMFNGIRDNEDPLEGIDVTLFRSDGEIVQETTTDEFGRYSFGRIGIGDYYVQFSEIDDRIFTIPDVGMDDSIDSDVTNSNGSGTTSLFTVENEQISKLDAGYGINDASLTITTWSDDNRNGILDSEELLFPGVRFRLYDQLNTLVYQSDTGFTGIEIINNILPGLYYVEFEQIDPFEFTIPNAGASETDDSDVTGEFGVGTTALFLAGGGGLDVQIGAGYIVDFGYISGLIWCDENGNGVREEGEAPVENSSVSLFDDSGEVRFSSSTDSMGMYSFDRLPLGTYYLGFNTSGEKEFTVANIGDEDRDSDVSGINGPGTSDPVDLISHQQVIMVDAGIRPMLNDVQGIAWIDENGDGQRTDDEARLPEVNVMAFNAIGVRVGTAQTDQQGRYTLAVPEGEYYLVFDQPSNFMFTDANLGDDATDSDVDGSQAVGSTALFTILDDETVNLDVGYISTTSSLNGIVWIDENEDGVRQDEEGRQGDIGINLYRADGSFVTSVNTNTDGIYTFDNIVFGDYYIEVEIPGGFNFSPADQGDDSRDSDITGANGLATSDTFTLPPGGESLSVDAGIVEGMESFSISGSVWEDQNGNNTRDDGEPFVADATVQLFEDNGTMVQTIMTNNDGQYSFDNLVPGIYVVIFPITGAFEFVTPNAGDDETRDSDVITVISTLGSTQIITIDNENFENVDAGIRLLDNAKNQVSGFVWLDDNGDGIANVTENGVNEIQVQLVNSAGGFLETTTQTDPISGFLGRYSFEDIPEDTYFIRFLIPDNLTFTQPNAGNNDLLDSEVTGSNGNGTTDSFSVEEATTILDLHAGLVSQGGSEGVVGDRVWIDIDENGIQDEGEPGLNGIRVRIFDSNDEFVAQTTSKINTETGESGYYEFTVPTGDYYVRADLTGGVTFSLGDQGNDDNIDSDISNENGFGTTSIFSVGANEIRDDIDIGMLVDPGSISGFLWLDENGNGVQDDDEPGVNNIEVRLFNNASVQFANTLTTNDPANGETGYFSFEAVPPGVYYIEFVIPDNYVITDPNQGGNDTKDSDIVGAFGRGSTAMFGISPSENETGICGGIFLPASLGDFVWLDANRNGLQDGNEDGVANVQVKLLDNRGSEIESTRTDAAGMYEFLNLKQGLYSVEFVAPDNFTFTEINQGNNDQVDSDVLPNGRTPLISLAHSVNFADLDAGLIPSTPFTGGDGDMLTGNFRGTSNDLEIYIPNLQEVEKIRLERSIDKMDFEMYKVISPEELEYSDYNITREGTYYYKIICSMADGSENISNIIALDVAFDKTIFYRTYPNPASERLYVKNLLEGTESILSVSLIDQRGQTLRSVENRLGGVTHDEEYVLNTVGLASGAYFLKVQTATKMFYEQIVIQN